MIILAAGQGTRLRPLTEDKPKCMVKYNNRPIIDYLLENASKSGIKNIAIVGGYKKDVLENYLENKNLTFYTNENYYKTNMVHTLFCAKNFMDDDLIISYSDIVYKQEILNQIINSKDDFSIIVDKNWKKLWSLRMSNPLNDAETLKVIDGRVVNLGKKAKDYSEIEGQYIGLIKVSKNIINKVINYYENLDQTSMYDGENFDNMYMTSFIQSIIDNFSDVRASYINGGWIEVDTKEDLKIKMLN